VNQEDRWIVESHNSSRYHFHQDGTWCEDETHGEDIIEHLPDCTGFDWVPTPKLQLREGAWYERKDGKIVGPCRLLDSQERHGELVAKWVMNRFWYDDAGTNPSDCCCIIREVEPPQPKVKHTPGPWTIEGEEIVGITRFHVAKVKANFDCHTEIQASSRRLIAESPEMYQIVERLATCDFMSEKELSMWVRKSREIMERIEQ
jgi:hypothetical protein